jgi:hypothetical protein
MALATIRAKQSCLKTLMRRSLATTFWESVSYCNYFQRAMRPPAHDPTQNDYEGSRDPFDAMLRHIAPDCFVIMSQRLWKDMKNDCEQSSMLGR